jgi:hypothetical protein
MDTARDGSLNRHGGTADMESNADERARERAEAVEERMTEILHVTWFAGGYCPECDTNVSLEDAIPHLATCELLRARAENEVDATERAR